MEKRSKLVVVGLAIIAVAFLYLIYVAGRGHGWTGEAAGARKPLPAVAPSAEAGH